MDFKNMICQAFLVLLVLDTAKLTNGYLDNICPKGPCGPGQKHSPVNDQCLPCDPGTFLNKTGHGCMDCDPCFKPEEFNKELLLRNCTPTRNSVIGCKKGYFFRNGTGRKKGTCYPCSICHKTTPETPHMAEPCSTFQDTVCSNTTTRMVTNSTSPPEANTSFPERSDSMTNQTRENSGKDGDSTTIILIAVIPSCALVFFMAVAVYCYKRRQGSSRQQKCSDQVKYSPTSKEEVII